MSIFYIIFIVLTAYYSFRYDRIEEYDSHKQHRLWLMCFYLICLSGFSYGLGGDKFSYMEEFEQYPSSFSEAGNYIWLQFMLGGKMPLWTLINIFAKSVFNSFYVVQFIESFAINVAVCYLASKYTHRYFLFLLVYFFSLKYFIFNTEVMREGMALSFVLVGVHGYMSGKKWLYYLSIPIGLLLHVTALAVIVFPFVRFKISWRTLAIASCVSFSVWLLSDLVLTKVMMMALGGMGAMVQKVLFYSLHASTFLGFLRSIITYLIFPFIIMYSVIQLEPSEEMRKHKERLMAYMVVFAVLVSAFAGFVRLYNHVVIFYLIMLADFIYMLFRYKEHLIIRVGTLAGTVFLIMLNYMIYYKTTNTYYYEFFYPYTCILHEDRNVYVREIAHIEAVEGEEKDNNVRDIK